MRTAARCLLLTGLIVLTPTARGQFAQQVSPNYNAPNPQSQAYARPAGILNQPVTPQYAPSYGYGAAPAYGYAPYGAGYQGRVGGYLNGVANVTTANSQALVTEQAARQGQAQADSAQLEYRKQLYDQVRYESMHKVTGQDIVEYDQRQAIRRARNDPPPVEIWAGTSLNVLLQNIQRTEATSGVFGPTVPLPPDLLKHVGVTAGVARGGATLFTEPLRWPVPLAVASFKPERDRVAGLMETAVKAIRASGAADPQTLVDLTAAIKAMQAKADAAVGVISPSDSIRCDRYLGELREGIQVLSQPDAAKAVGGAWSAKGDTVGQLVANLTMQGLKFAPANSGDEPYYTALYQALLTYDSGLGRLVSR